MHLAIRTAKVFERLTWLCASGYPMRTAKVLEDLSLFLLLLIIFKTLKKVLSSFISVYMSIQVYAMYVKVPAEAKGGCRSHPTWV